MARTRLLPPRVFSWLLALAGALSICASLAPGAQASTASRSSATRAGQSLGAWVGVTLTTHNLADALTRMPNVRFSTAPTHAPTLNVNESARYQSVDGFGAAMTDSSAWLLYDGLSPAARATVMDQLFSQASGIGLNFVRVPMGASDFSATGVPYSYDDMPAGQSDPTLAHFSIAHDMAYIVPALRQMMAINPSTDLLSTEWSAPAWMKTNDAFNNNSQQGQLVASDYEPLADYFVKFIQAYAAQGIPIWAVTPQNEPLAPAPYPGMALSAVQEGQFISQNLAPALSAAGLHTLIYGGDDASGPYAQALMSTSAAADMAGMAWHCYGGQQTMSQFHALHPTVAQLMSECSPGIIPYGAAEAAISGTRNWASAIDMWNLALSPAGGPVEPPDYGCPHCSGLVTVTPAHTVTYNRNFYELGQLSKFVKRGAVRISTPRWVTEFQRPTGYGVTSGLDNVAFLDPDGTRVLVAYNNSPAPITFGVADAGKRFAYTLPRAATVTFTWR